MVLSTDAPRGPSTVRVQCKVDRPDLIHCVVRPPCDPPGKLHVDDLSSIAEKRPALDLGYAMDEYQQIATHALELSESVIVSAPTSSGKTTVALSALDLCLRRGGRAMFCAPIKALSNQMFAEFHSRFPGEVGLLTGDHCIAPNSPILVATTEIFRCLLRHDCEFVMHLQTAVFDEVHYMSDTERGSAWEDSMVMLPPGVSIVCLSATMANPVFLAGWLCQLKGRPVHAVQKRGRPVPLSHYAYPIGASPDGLLEVRTATGQVDRKNIDMAAKAARAWHISWLEKQEKRKARQKEIQEEEEKRGHKASVKRDKAKEALNAEKEKSLRHLVCSLVKQGRCPILVFCFRKGDCDQLAYPLLRSGQLALREDAEEKARKIRKIIGAQLAWLPEADKNCEQLWWACDHLLPQGIGVHHGGVVPVLRELVEILFKTGLLDVLFCTETFGMGLNMPARLVIFHFRSGLPLTKFDGSTQRPLTATEYQQMSGRAGRRMLDTAGMSILTLDDPFKSQVLADMLNKPCPSICSRYEVQVAAALNILQHGPFYLQWFGLQTLTQFECQDQERPALHDSMVKLINVMSDPEIALLKPTGWPTDLGRACAAMECGDALLLGLLLSADCFDNEDPVDLLAYFTTFVLERDRPDSFNDAGTASPKQDLVRFAGTCEYYASIVDSVVVRHDLMRREDESGLLVERLKNRGYLAEPFHSTWLSGSSFDELVKQCQLDAGSVTRLVRRVDECGRQVAVALRAQGKHDVAAGLDRAANNCLRRGPPFCESLYFPKEFRGKSNDALDDLLASRLAEPAEDPWASPHACGELVFLDPRAVGFSHDTIMCRFQDGDKKHALSGQPLRRIVWQLVRGELSAQSISQRCPVVFYRGLPYTLGNRRLCVLRLYTWLSGEGVDAVELPFRVASQEEAIEWGWEGKFTTGCFRGARTIIRETGEVVGVNLQDSLCSLEEESDEFDYDTDEIQNGELGKFLDLYNLLPTNVREPEQEVVDEAVAEPLVDSRICFECGEVGHINRNCPYLAGRRQAAACLSSHAASSSLSAPIEPPKMSEEAFPTLGGLAARGPKASASQRATPPRAAAAQAPAESNLSFHDLTSSAEAYPALGGLSTRRVGRPKAAASPQAAQTKAAAAMPIELAEQTPGEPGVETEHLEKWLACQAEKTACPAEDSPATAPQEHLEEFPASQAERTACPADKPATAPQVPVRRNRWRKGKTGLGEQNPDNFAGIGSGANVSSADPEYSNMSPTAESAASSRRVKKGLKYKPLAFA